MSDTAREAILTRLRQARTGLPRPVAPVAPAARRGPVDFTTLAAAFATQGVAFDLAPDADAARRLLTEIMARHEVRTAVAWEHPDLAAIDAPAVLDAADVALIPRDELPERPCPALAAVDMGLTGVTAALCATGTLVLAASPVQPRSVPLVPRLHVALVAKSRLLPDPAAFFAGLSAPMPSAYNLVSGVSSTGDIEFVYVRGVHGPLEVHVIGLDWR